ncbi:rhodanese-like domain-containing protein [Methanococcus voltae]|uniref:Rhodanese domain protein n=1 Tax=Methanococcus voltae (strain ATCC BAA-1334 / A3) TaxID=456320 RepID=D7DSD9_METV3|nr:rhodanese-like domain-containing protein [Methanococcus voltae]MCS3901575.1 tRNA 2-selenouridine synthase [Methanococcus voltae]
MDEEILSRLLTFKKDVILVIILHNGSKVITDGEKILAGKLNGELASFILKTSKDIKNRNVKKPELYTFEKIEDENKLIYFEPIDIKSFLKSIGGELDDSLITNEELSYILSDLDITYNGVSEYIETENDIIDGYDNFKENYILIDARAPNEYNEKRIPHSINIPLFMDDEHKNIGIAFKKEGKERAIELAGNYMKTGIPRLVDEFLKLDKDKEIIVYCARGGMRSQTIATLLKLMGFKTKRLIGGFKGYKLK